MIDSRARVCAFTGAQTLSDTLITVAKGNARHDMRRNRTRT